MAPEPTITISLSAFASTILVILSASLIAIIGYAFAQINKNRHLIDENDTKRRKEYGMIQTDIGVLKNDMKWVIETLTNMQTKLN